jgi:L-cysteine/cystine lyase
MDTGPLKASDAIVALDGAQGLGAVPLDVHELGCHFYAASGQKWLCGPGGIGYLYASPELVGSLPAPWSGYHALEDSERALDPALWPDARRFGTGFPVPHHVEWAHASLGVLDTADPGRGIEQAELLVGMLGERGVTVAPRGRSTLVSFEVPDPPAFSERAAAEGIVIRGIPGHPLARASVGAWNSSDELERLAELAASASRP